MELVAVIESIVFRNETNSYTVVRIVDVNNNKGTAVGRFPLVMEGERVRLVGEVVNSKFGEQLQCTSVEILKPNTLEGIVKYLSSGLIKGVGVKTAEKIVDRFKEDTLDVIEFNHNMLASVPGITEKKAEKIYDSYSQIKEMQNSVMFLQDYGISVNLAVKIYDIYKSHTIEVVKANPYRLIEDVDGIGFKTADKIAHSIGVELDSSFRIRAGLVYTLKESSEKNGNTFLSKDELIFLNSKLLDISFEENYTRMQDVLQGLQMDNFVRIIDFKDKEIVMLSKLYQTEYGLSQSIIQLLTLAENNELDVEDDIKMFELIFKIDLHETQKEAVKMAVNKGFSVITGGPGTGKTTIIKCILSILKNMNLKVKLLAPTGRASKRLSDSTGEEASTIHRALEIDFRNGKTCFVYNETNKMDVDAVIVDEVSMVDAQLMYSLVKALHCGTKVILVGDKDQLPSVGAGNVLADLLDCGVVPVCELKKIYRQSGNSLIIENAHLINEGKMPIIDNTSDDFFFEVKTTPADIANSVVELVTKRIPKHFNVESGRIQVLAPLKVGVCGVENLNRELQEKLNTASRSKEELEYGDTTFRLGDKVMQISNNYSMEWQKYTDGYLEDGTGVFNGDIGVIVSVNRSAREIVVVFEDGRNCVYTSNDFNQLVLSYAITIHKSQGSEFDYVVIPVISGSPYMLTRNLIYTAVTRAKKMVILVGEKENLNKMVRNNYTARRNSMLKPFIQDLVNDEERMNFIKGIE
ncbi:MAG: ATP-dependent RecD-like DNA helicase [Christensenellales bacterium]